MKECEKLSQRTEEWNHIYPFMEWLQQQGIVLAEYKYTIIDYPTPISKSIEQLLYEYFEINPQKLEQERREILEELRRKQK